MHLVTEEPEATGWTTTGLDALATRLLAGHTDGPWVVAVDGRGGSGKSTLGARLAARLPGSALVHTDDLSWHEPFFAWGHLERELLEAYRRDGSVRLAPPAWAAHGRDGAVVVPPGTRVLVVEGNAAAQQAVAGLVDVVVWVQADLDEAERRGIERDVADGANGDREQAVAFWHEWWEHEARFFADDRPWERADVVVCGTPAQAAPNVVVRDDEVLVARG